MQQFFTAACFHWQRLDQGKLLFNTVAAYCSFGGFDYKMEL
jgi:hypothetical protein